MLKLIYDLFLVLKGVKTMVWPLGLKWIFGLLLVALALWTVLVIWKAVTGKRGWIHFGHAVHRTRHGKGT